MLRVVFRGELYGDFGSDSKLGIGLRLFGLKLVEFIRSFGFCVFCILWLFFLGVVGVVLVSFGNRSSIKVVLG